MAEIISKSFPIDYNYRKAVGFALPMDGNAVFRPTYTTRDQIKSNLINYMLTNKGERGFNPNFGSNLRALLFEQIDDGDLDDLLEVIQLNITADKLILIKGQPLTGQLEKNRKEQFQRAESFAGDR